MKEPRILMELLIWVNPNRKRSNKLAYSDPNFVVGYDLDMADFSALVDTYNQRNLLPEEETRLHKYVMTMMNIVLENPKINPSKGEIDELTDVMYLDGWGSLKHIKPGVKPYSYIYRSMYTAACTRYYLKKIKERLKADAIEQHCQEQYTEWLDEVSDHKVNCLDKPDQDCYI